MDLLRSGLLKDQDQQKIKRAIPKASNKVVDSAVARLYVAHPNPNQWTWTGLMGAICLVDDLVGHTWYLKLVDIEGNMGVLWDQELYVDFQYNQDRTFFHSFDLEECQAGLLFEDRHEAARFIKKIQQRAKHGSKATNANKQGLVRAAPEQANAKAPPPVPAAPTAINTGFKTRVKTQVYYDDDEIPVAWRELYQLLFADGVTEEMIASQTDFIKDYIREYGGPLSGLEPPVPRRFSARAAVSAPAPTAPSAASRRAPPPPPPPPPAQKQNQQEEESSPDISAHPSPSPDSSPSPAATTSRPVPPAVPAQRNVPPPPAPRQAPPVSSQAPPASTPLSRPPAAAPVAPPPRTSVPQAVPQPPPRAVPQPPPRAVPQPPAAVASPLPPARGVPTPPVGGPANPSVSSPQPPPRAPAVPPVASPSPVVHSPPAAPPPPAAAATETPVPAPVADPGYNALMASITQAGGSSSLRKTGKNPANSNAVGSDQAVPPAAAPAAPPRAPAVPPAAAPTAPPRAPAVPPAAAPTAPPRAPAVPPAAAPAAPPRAPAVPPAAAPEAPPRAPAVPQSAAPAPPAAPLLPTGAPPAPAPPAAPPLPTGDTAALASPPAEVAPAHNALMAAITQSSTSNLKKTDKSHLERPSVLTQQSESGPGGAPASAAAAGAPNMASAIAAALSQRRKGVQGSDDEDDGEDWD